MTKALRKVIIKKSKLEKPPKRWQFQKGKIKKGFEANYIRKREINFILKAISNKWRIAKHFAK